MSLYHYTSISNIEKIVRPNKVDLIATYYQKFAEEDYAWIRTEGKILVKELCEELGYEYDPDYLAHRPYITSFCTCPNSEYMWSVFGDNGEGAVLVINEQILHEEASLVENYARIVPCEYIDPQSDKQKKKDIIMKIASNDYLYDCPNDDRLMFAVMGVMQNKFYEEQEVRYVQIEKLLSTVYYKDGMAQVEKYNVPSDKWVKHVYFPKDILKGIIFGKKVDQYDYDYFKNYMLECGYNPDLVCKAE